MGKFRSTIEVEFESADIARKAHDSLIQETEFTKKSRASLKVKGKELVISISADDFASLRATVGSYARLLSVFFSAKEVLEKE